MQSNRRPNIAQPVTTQAKGKTPAPVTPPMVLDGQTLKQIAGGVLQTPKQTW